MKSIVTLMLVISFNSCGTTSLLRHVNGEEYRYSFEIVSPKSDTALSFEDENLKIDFSMSNTDVNFNMLNKTDSPLKIIWDEAAMVIAGEAEKIFHKGIKYADRNLIQPPTTIPGGARYSDLLVATVNIYRTEAPYTRTSTAGGWETREIFPTYDLNEEKVRKMINNLEGSEFQIYLPMKTGSGKEIGYNFKFRVREVTCVTCPASSKTNKKN